MSQSGSGGQRLGSGRRIDPVWQNFNVIVNEDQMSQNAECKACSTMISARPERLKSHLEKCVTLKKVISFSYRVHYFWKN